MTWKPWQQVGKLTYNLHQHAFYLDGKRCWGITTALAKDPNSKRYGDSPAWTRDRGRAVAKAISNYVMQLDPTVHKDTPLHQFVLYTAHNLIQHIASEVFLPFLVDQIPCIAILDLLSLDRLNNLILTEVKTGQDHPTFGLQTAAQEEALRQHGIEIHERQVLHLTNHKFEISRHRRPRDLKDFQDLIRTLGPRHI